MRKIVLSALIAGAAIAATPASAQGWNYRNPAANAQIRAEIEQLSQRISQAEARRRISHREAQALRRQSIQVQRNFHAFSRNGIDRREYAVLNNALQQIRQNLRAERRDLDRRRG